MNEIKKLAIILGLMSLILLIATRTADAHPSWSTAKATWYGPGFYGNTTACGQRYTQQIRGVAYNKGPCGAKFTICRRGLCVRVIKIDTGGFSHTFDLSARTAMDLCRCWSPYTMSVRYRHGW